MKREKNAKTIKESQNFYIIEQVMLSRVQRKMYSVWDASACVALDTHKMYIIYFVLYKKNVVFFSFSSLCFYFTFLFARFEWEKTTTTRNDPRITHVASTKVVASILMFQVVSIRFVI